MNLFEFFRKKTTAPVARDRLQVLLAHERSVIGKSWKNRHPHPCHPRPCAWDPGCRILDRPSSNSQRQQHSCPLPSPLDPGSQGQALG